MGLAAGRLNHLIELRRATKTDDGHGGQVTTWDTVATWWAEAISQNGREAIIAGALTGVSVYRFTIRYRPDVSTSDQVRFEGRDFNIRSAEPDHRRERVDILAETGTASA